jgi:signal transduction histidine kinase
MMTDVARSTAPGAAACSIDEALAMISHELRQPLGAIFMAMEMQKRSLSPERRQRSAEIIEEQVKYIARLVDNLSDASAIERGIVLHNQRLDAREVLRRAIETTAPSFSKRRHRLVLSQSARPVWVLADETRLQEVFSNLLQNSAVYTTDGGRIEVSLETVDDRVQFRVLDDGIGIHEDSIDRIFELFERGAHAGVPGAGIGLALVKSLVRLHGGTISVRSDGPGCGSEFLVSLPAFQ